MLQEYIIAQQLPAEAPVCGANTVGGHRPSPALELCLYD